MTINFNSPYTRLGIGSGIIRVIQNYWFLALDLIICFVYFLVILETYGNTKSLPGF